MGKRLKSLDEFEDPPWRVAANREDQRSLAIVIVIGATAGVLLGLILLT